MMILLWIIIGFGVYYLLNSSKSNKSDCCLTPKKKPEELLKERFVKGEIDEETYIKMKETLNK